MAGYSYGIGYDFTVTRLSADGTLDTTFDADGVQRIDFVHVLYDGRIVRTGGKELALELEEKGYDWIIHHEAVTA